MQLNSPWFKSCWYSIRSIGAGGNACGGTREHPTSGRGYHQESTHGVRNHSQGIIANILGLKYFVWFLCKIFNDLMHAFLVRMMPDAVVGDPSRWYHHTYLLNLKIEKEHSQERERETSQESSSSKSLPAQPSSIEQGIDPSSFRCKTLSRTFVCAFDRYINDLTTTPSWCCLLLFFLSVPHPYPQILPMVQAVW